MCGGRHARPGVRLDLGLDARAPCHPHVAPRGIAVPSYYPSSSNPPPPVIEFDGIRRAMSEL